MPSSRFLIDRLLQPINFSRPSTVVELGVGDGCITREILSRMGPESRLICVEVEEQWVKALEDIHDARLTVYHACATDLKNVLLDAAVPHADYVVSSVPLTILDDELADEVLSVAQACLNPGGMFLQYQYSPTYLRKLTARYEDVRLGFTLRNIPPAFVYECVNGVA